MGRSFVAMHEQLVVPPRMRTVLAERLLSWTLKVRFSPAAPLADISGVWFHSDRLATQLRERCIKIVIPKKTRPAYQDHGCSGGKGRLEEVGLRLG